MSGEEQVQKCPCGKDPFVIWCVDHTSDMMAKLYRSGTNDERTRIANIIRKADSLYNEALAKHSEKEGVDTVEVRKLMGDMMESFARIVEKGEPSA